MRPPIAEYIFALTIALCPALLHAETIVAAPAFDFVQTSDAFSGGRPNAAERERLARLQILLHQWLAEHRLLAPIMDRNTRDKMQAEAAQTNLRACRACAVELARSVGADWIALGWVQKVSELILNVNLIVIDANTEDVVAARSVDMRGNTDASWQRALERLLDERLSHDLTQAIERAPP